MSKYSTVTLDAIKLVREGANPGDAWKSAASAVFVDSPSSRDKGCPRSTFLGLIDQSLVRGVTPGGYTRSVENKQYATEAVEQLRRSPKLADYPGELWEEVQAGVAKQHNYQMDVVTALWKNGDIVT
jgi:hypothetical protein